MESWIQLFIAIFSSVAASGGLWNYLIRRDKTRSATDRLLRGLAYKELMASGMALIERGWVTKDELEEFRKYLYEPYKALGGNGVVDRVMREVDNLQLRNNLVHTMMIRQVRGSGDSNGRHHRRQASDDDQRAFAE